MITADETLTAAQSSAVFIELPRGIFLLSGSDAARYLHGRVTQDIKSLRPGECAYTLLLTPQGRTLGQLLLANLGERYLALSDPLETPEERSELLRSLLLFKVADDVQSSDLSEEYVSIAVVGAQSASAAKSIFASSFEQTASPKLPLVTEELSYFIHAPLGDYDGIEIIAPRSRVGELRDRLEAHGATAIGFEAYEALRITAGVPRMGAEISEKLIGADLPLERTVAFRKGCYAGQEVIEMATARGRPNRRLIALRAAGPISAGAEVFAIEAGERKAVGVVTSAVFLPQHAESRALAFIKFATPEAAPLEVGGTSVSSYSAGR